LEKSKCKIGITDNLERRLKEYNSITGKSKDNVYEYLFTCEVKHMRKIEEDIKKEFRIFREEQSREIYFYNTPIFEKYVSFIKNHKSFVKETFIKPDDKRQIVKIVKKTTPSLKERGVSRKDIMQRAKRIDNDEFYTRYEDVVKEIEMYDVSIWKNKVVFCNCDDAVDDEEKNTSAFALYFLENFIRLKLKKLICTHYSGPVDLFNQGSEAYIFTKDGFTAKKDFYENYSGSFDDPISLDILNNDADIVCTNPPFSRMVDYWKTVIGSGKKFLIISNIAIILTTAYIPYFRNKQVWAGYNRIDYYQNPKRELVEAAGHWYTNLRVKDRPKYKQLKIVPLKKIPDKYKRYDDSKVLLVDNCYIPDDYKKPFAVSARSILNGLLEKGYEIVQDKEYYPYINNEKCFSRVLVRKIQ